MHVVIGHEVGVADREESIVFVTRYFPPAYLAGGPPRSVAALVEAISSKIDVRVISSSFDLGRRPLAVTADQWVSGPASTYFASSDREAVRQLWRTISNTERTTLHLNSLFDRTFGLAALAVGILRGHRIIVAPRGELASGALSIKPVRKRLLLTLLRLGRIQSRVEWHATAETEASDIRHVLGSEVVCHVAPVIRQPPALPDRRRDNLDSTTRIVFYSRIAPKKNLKAAIEIVGNLPDCHLTVAGPIDDDVYAAECRSLVQDLGLGNRVEFAGALPSDEAIDFLSNFDLFLLPTLGENYGHVIFESLAAGTPVVIADTTPWTSVSSAGAGYVCPLGKMEAFQASISAWTQADTHSRQAMRAAARALAQESVKGSVSPTLVMFGLES